MSGYFSTLSKLKDSVVNSLAAKGAPSELLQLGGPGTLSGKSTRVPGDAKSEFLANRAMGDWAEDLLAAALRAALSDYIVSKYGDAHRIPAGDPGFKDFYIKRLEDVRLFGKRPDLLIFPKTTGAAEDLTDQPTKDLIPLVRKANGAIEVRSSKHEALHYMKVKLARREGKKANDRDVPSFTVKIEDLNIIYRWIEKHHVPQIYAQVFFDSIFALNVIDIFKIIASGDGFRLERPHKSQGKNTVMIPVTSGKRIDKGTKIPDFGVEKRRTELGRHDAYVVPKGGSTTIDRATFLSVLVGG